MEMPLTTSGKTIIRILNKYTFGVDDTIVFIEHMVVRGKWSNEEISVWVDELATEIRTVLR